MCILLRTVLALHKEQDTEHRKEDDKLLLLPRLAVAHVAELEPLLARRQLGALRVLVAMMEEQRERSGEGQHGTSKHKDTLAHAGAATTI